MTPGRLTRRELGWLLTQEARGAALKLREEVTELRAGASFDEDRVSSLPGERSLDALDGAIDVLSQLQGEPRSRRTTLLDLSALLYQLAPDWQLVLEPGAAQVSGDPEALRRVLQVLLTQSGLGGTTQKGAPAVEVRRDGPWVKVTTSLGPDAGTHAGLEGRWLSRMAVRLGGRYELQGRSQSLCLPAGDDDRVEVEALREELSRARQLGENYARDLDRALSRGPIGPSLAAASRSTARWVLSRAAEAFRSEPDLALAVFAALERVSEDAPATDVELTELVARATAWVRERRPDAVIRSECPSERVSGSPDVLVAQLALLLLDAVRAAPSGASVGAVKDGAMLHLEVRSNPRAEATLETPIFPPPSFAKPGLALLAAAALADGASGPSAARVEASDRGSERCHRLSIPLSSSTSRAPAR